MKLFRYRTANINTLGEIANSQLWYSRLSDLNDPFEGMYINQSGDDTFDRLLAQTRVCCYSKSHDNLLLWAHYADGHRGLCLEYEITEWEKTRFMEVRYTDERPVLKSIPRYPKGHPHEGKLRINIAREGAISLTKSEAWAYEMEVRSFQLLVEDQTRKGVSGRCPDTLTAIYFGFRASSTVISTINRILPQTGPTALFRADLDPERFKLVFSPLDRNTL
jgi:hypothetical protein